MGSLHPDVVDYTERDYAGVHRTVDTVDGVISVSRYNTLARGPVLSLHTAEPHMFVSIDQAVELAQHLLNAVAEIKEHVSRWERYRAASR